MCGLWMQKRKKRCEMFLITLRTILQEEDTTEMDAKPVFDCLLGAGGRGGKETSFVKDFFMRHSGAGQPSVRSGNRMVAKGKNKRKELVITIIHGKIEFLRTH